MPLTYRNTAASLTLRALIERNRQPGFGGDLGGYLRRVAQATVLGVALSACGSSHTLEDGGTDTGVMEDTSVMGDVGPTDTSVIGDTSIRPDTNVPDATVVMPGPFCTDDGQWDALSGVETSRGDYVGLFSEDIFSFGGPGAFRVTQERGVACETATEPARCQAQLDRLVAETSQRALFLTTHDGAYAITDGFAAMELMGGNIDTANKAALIAWFAGYEIHCTGPSLTTITPRGDGWHVVAYRYSYETCDVNYYRAELYVDGFEGTVEPVADEEYLGILTTLCAIGRRPAGLVERKPTAPIAPVADFFAEVTRLEESAVAAFDIMIDELTRLGAPEALLVAAREARADEVRHTSSMGLIARAYGAEPLRPEVAVVPRERTLFEIALENAVEGCVRETYGALVAAHQALRAEDPRIASAMDTVASDEIRHAELSWALAAWLEPQLTDDERAQIEAAKREAVTQIAASAYAPVHPSLVALAGMPDGDANTRMVAELTRDLWN